VGTLESTRERLATPGSEFCVVVREGGTKRKQPVLKPCHRARNNEIAGALVVRQAGQPPKRREG